jgi:hypothetical protein
VLGHRPLLADVQVGRRVLELLTDVPAVTPTDCRPNPDRDHVEG